MTLPRTGSLVFAPCNLDTLPRVTVLETIQKSTDFLARKGVDSPRLQSESILAHVLNLPRMQLYLDFQRELSEAQISQCRDLVRRRADRHPLQHLLGSVSFCGLDIRVNEQALIPRPETEQLVEHAAAALRRLNAPTPTVLDLGTGTGCIAVALAVQWPTARLWATDISPGALELARANAAAHQVPDRISFLCGNGFEALPPTLRFHVIVSNPPYIPTQEIETLQPEVRDHDPRIALDGGPDGLAFYRLLAAHAPVRLSPEGVLIVEFGDGQADPIRHILECENWIVDAPLPDYSDRERFLIARPSSRGGAHFR